MKKTRQQSVLTLFTAAVFLFGSSGGVAWGQIYQSQRNPDRAQLRNGINGSIDANISGNRWEYGTWDVTSSFDVDNNYGPGETGVLTPKSAGNSINTGDWTYGNTTKPQIFNPDGGIITVGGTSNHVGHMAKKGIGVTSLNYDSGHGLAGTQGHAHAQANLRVNASCTTGGYRDGYISTNNNSPRNDNVIDTQLPGVSPGLNPTFDRYYGPAQVRVTRPTTPNEDGVRSSDVAPTYAPTETAITINGSSKIPSQPWYLQKFNFLENKWYYYITTFTHFTQSHRVEFDYYLPTYTCDPCPTISNPSRTCTNWTGYSSHTAKSVLGSADHLGVDWSTAGGNLGGTINARIKLLPNSHVRLTGSGGQSIGHGTLNSTTAYLNLPNSFYTLMNDEAVAFDNIVYNSDGTNVVNPELGVNAVFGINKTLDKDLKTNPLGGTILIGSTTDATSQGHMTITSSTATNGSAYGFDSKDANCTSVYTDTWIPAEGTTNLGNYGVKNLITNPTEAQRAITIESTMNLAYDKVPPSPNTMNDGKVQVFNKIGNITFNNTIPKVPAYKKGNFLIMAKDTLDMRAGLTSTIAANGIGSITLMASKVKLNTAETATLEGKGNYNVIAFDEHTHTVNNVTTTYNGEIHGVGYTPKTICNLSAYSQCRNIPAEIVPTMLPGNLTRAFNGQSGQNYTNNHPCAKPTFLPRNTTLNHAEFGGGVIKSTQNSTVNVKDKGFARWIAGYLISAGGPSLTYNWKVHSTASDGATASWHSEGGITLHAGSTANWENEANAAGNAPRIFWNAGGSINVNKSETVWKTIAQSGMYWRAGGSISITNNGNQTTEPKVEWTSTNAGDMHWEAGENINVVNDSKPLKFTQTGTGSTRWNANNNINVTAGTGGIEFTNSSNAAPSFSTPYAPNEMLWWAGNDIITGASNQKIEFKMTTQHAGKTAWNAGHNIQTKGQILFHNDDTNNEYNMEWVACSSILTNYNATTADGLTNPNGVKFTNSSKSGSMIWHAGDSIVTRSKTEFTTDQATSEGHMTWYAGEYIRTRLGTADNSQSLTEGVIFTQKGKGRTAWWANTGNIQTYNPVHFDWSQAGSDAASILWWAGTHIEIGNNYNPNTPGISRAMFQIGDKNDTITLKTGEGHILTNSQVDIERENRGKALTQLWAGCQNYGLDNNIDIENVFNYTEPTGKGQGAESLVHLYAENDILSNQDAANACDNREAPITFEVPSDSKTRTLWDAERNINTRSRVEFKYGEATNMGPLTWLSRAGYIQTERPVKITYKSDSTISFLAENEFNGHNTVSNPTKVHANADKSGRRGNIHFFDSVDIQKPNMPAARPGGLTQIKAENHIWTAMLNFQDMGSIGDTMEIISHKGDIYLGYNDGKTTGAAISDDQYVAYWQTPGSAVTPPWNITQRAPSAGCGHPTAPDVSYDKNRFTYSIPQQNKKGHLWIKAGWQELTDRNAVPDPESTTARTLREAGGNIYFTHIDVNQDVNSDHPTEISIPFSGLWRCGNATTQDSVLHTRAFGSMQRYENAGIISGVNPCLTPYPTPDNTTAADTGLIYRGGKGRLTVDAGNRGNIIFNKGAYLNFQSPTAMTGDAIFRTREGDIDMRDPFNVDSMRGSLFFLAQVENLSDLQTVGICGCKEERNNVYLQDFQYRSIENGGSVFVGADNNIKLNYGGLQNVGTRHDPFLSTDYKPCPKGGQAKIGRGYLGHTKAEARLETCHEKALHCDANAAVNQARIFLLNFAKDKNNNDVKSGGFAAVASDYIDVYKKFEYYGGKGSGMGSVPSTGTLHGESVSGYGLFMKTQANKNNWNINIFKQYPDCPTTCDGTNCDRDYLHMVARMTFHDDAYIEAHNQRVLLTSPVVESFGKMTLNTATDHGSNTQITLKADSLIFHDDFVKLGNSVKLSTWSGLHKDLPIMKFGHKRYTPPFTELMYDNCDDTVQCAPCHYYIRGSKDPLHMMDTITIKFGDGAYLERLNTVVFDHTVLTCLTDSFDHVMGGVQNAQIFTDTFKIRNQVDLFADKYHERDAHLELISEQQMHSKDYAGIYTKHLHMEPIGACERPYSELWTSDDRALDVITTSIFGGFGFIHADVHVENLAHLNAGFTSLRLKGMCYEHLCGTQRMEDLRLDGGAQLHFSVGTTKGLNNEYCDAIDVDLLTAYGPVDVNIEVRPCEKMERRCYPIIYYKSLTPNSLNGFRLNPSKIKIDGEEVPLTLNTSTDGVVYVCVGDALVPDVNHTVSVPSVAGVTTDPGPGFWKRPARSNFKFKAKYTTEKPLAVRANYMVRGVEELLEGKLNANGEYEYIIPHLMEDVRLTIGPDPVANEFLAGAAVWSYGEQIYFRVDRSEIASIYSVAGQLVRKIELPEGDSSIPMRRGAYVITLRDGSVHKVIVR